jgi:galacturonosyltransferase
MKSKGIDYFLESAKYVSKKYPNTVFHIIGDLEEDYNDKITDYVSKGYINYHGKTNDIRDFLKLSHATIHPSFHEGMSNVLLESAASGRPVIASNIPGCKETFVENKSGLSFILKDQESLNQTIEKFIKLPYEYKKQMGIAGRDKMVKEFSRENVVNKYIEAINKTLEDKK